MSCVIYSKIKLDGWPYCPSCGEDELFCTEWPAAVERIEGCYVCGWKPGNQPRTPSPNRSV